MSTPRWLADTRTSYDTVAEGYAEFFRDGLARHPYVRACLTLFAELLQDVGGPVLDIGCGTGLLAGQLHDLGIEVFGIDLSPGMLEIARHNHPDLRFEVGSMTDLDVPDSSVGGLLAYYCVIHVPDEEIPTVFSHFHRVLRPGGLAMIGFHVGDERRHKTEGYGGRPMNVHLHRRPVDRMTSWLRDAGLTVEAQFLTGLDTAASPGCTLFARRPNKIKKAGMAGPC